MMTAPRRTPLIDNLGLVESPRWHDGRLWFSDWIAGEIISVARTGAATVEVRHQGLPLCFDFLPDGRLVVVSNQRNALLVRNDNSLDIYADLSGSSEHGAGNDIVIDSRGNAYVNNPNYAAMQGPPPDGPVQPGFISLVTPDGRARVVATDLAFPNGMAVTADNATLLVAESHRGRISAFPIADDGSLGTRRTWAEIEGSAPDGICLDSDGALWYADVPARACHRIAEGGAVLDSVTIDRGAFACMLDRGSDHPSLYVTAARWPGMGGFDGTAAWDGQLLQVEAARPGGGWPGN